MLIWSRDDLEYDELSVTALAAVEGDVLIASVWVEAADALLSGQERGMNRFRRGRVWLLLSTGYGV